jgi:AraC-like DNA-binding protein
MATIRETSDSEMKHLATARRYPFAQNLAKLCALLKISPERVLRRAGYPADFIRSEDKGATAGQVFALWNAVDAEVKDANFAIPLAQTTARGTFSTPVFAFSCSPDVETGLKRLALFKPLVGPFHLSSGWVEEGLEITISSAERGPNFPVSLAVFELVFFLEMVRNFTAENIVPLAVGMPDMPNDAGELESVIGVKIDRSRSVSILLSAEDGRRPLISRDDQVWPEIEKFLQRQLGERDRSTAIATRVRNALFELLPSGESSADAVCNYLHISKRSLFRHLRNEGHSYQQLLDATRTELSLHYLSSGDISVEEISYLLAFSDPNSFYRAFRGWTGMTPLEARGQQAH